MNQVVQLPDGLRDTLQFRFYIVLLRKIASSKFWLLLSGESVHACGVSEESTIAADSFRIVGGVDAPDGAWPWMVALYYGNHFACGGSLVQPDIVVTAAHCIANKYMSSAYSVLINSNKLGSGRRIKVKSLHPHPFFNKSIRPAYDIAVLQLLKPAVENSSKSLVCLPTSDVAPGQKCIVTGWGRTVEGGSPSKMLQQIKVPILTNAECNAPSRYSGFVSPTMFCAGFDEGGRDSCQGDSGGPLVCEQDGIWELRGTVSWGIGCARPMRPGVYSRKSKKKHTFPPVTEKLATMQYFSFLCPLYCFKH
ncbi:Transmembrane protease serine 2 [Trichinella nativa]|uniref:Transmembrane protease serine 2 n=1 Tax=Trichinella nativa TaxID=6335 RepID=A0A0V1LUT8_9BILA|nr:Transmembrane protease serine 2 [Trichinella sp. T6]KRZ63288.1 Transmembrane protease serine 2 [Trichinella nativa]